MTRPFIVAWNTFREAVRDRILYSLVFFALLMIAAAILVGQISIGIEESVIVTLGLSAISVIGLLIAVFVGVALVSKEIDKRTLYGLLSKPVHRWEFLLGKFGGLLLTLAVNTAAMATGLFLALLYVRQSFERTDAAVLVAVYFILLKLAIVVALAMLFSCFTTPLLSILYTAGFYVAGLFVLNMRDVQGQQVSAFTRGLLRVLSYLLPNFENFDVMSAAAHGHAIPAALVAQNTAYAALYCALLLIIAMSVFARRDLK
jgi:ABC-type transport system involved in multi-copper enzyme maturation permease subunit